MKKTNNQKGITLIALILTIILLLILAGVTISLLTGENNILRNAKIAAEQYKIGQGKERIELILAEIDMEEIETGIKKETEEIAGIIRGKNGITEAEKIDEDTIKVTTKEGYEYEVTIDEEGKTDVKYTGETEKEESDNTEEDETPEEIEPTPSDEIAPVVSIETGNISFINALIRVTATDEGSGLAEEGTYKYYLGDELQHTSTTNSYLYKDLTAETTYTLKVVVTDKAGNQTETTTNITTAAIPIPTGFVASSLTTENTVNGGFVIYEGTTAVTSSNHSSALTSRNQYVLLPISDINSMCMCKSNAEGSVCNLQLQTDGTLQCIIHPETATQIVGRVYTDVTESETPALNSSGDTIDLCSYIINFDQTNQTYQSDTEHREPAVHPSTAYDNSTNNYHGYGTADAFLTELETEYKAMATSVAKYGGFYVSRYEMGTGGVSKKGQTILNASGSSTQRWYGLYKLAKTANTTLNSYMLWGSQWDQIVKFIGAEAQTASVNKQKITAAVSGANSNDIFKNMYDLEANHSEWTIEADSSRYRVLRGGNWDDAELDSYRPVSLREYASPTVSDSYIATRYALYL